MKKPNLEQHAHAPVQAIDAISRAVDDNVGRLAVMERLFWLLAANDAYDNNQYVDFGKIRNEGFWHGLHQLAEAAAEATQEIQSHANTLYDEARDGDKAGVR